MELIAKFGMYGVFTPYDSHDGSVGYTVQTLDPETPESDDLGGFIIAEFHDKVDALMFAEEKSKQPVKADF